MILDYCKLCSYYDGLYCEKVGGKKIWYGYCSDALENIAEAEKSVTYPKEICQKKKRKNKRERDAKYRNHLKKLAEYTNKRWFSVVATYVEKGYDRKNHTYVYLKKPYYKRLYKTCGLLTYEKRRSNKIIRRSQKYISNGCEYKKHNDLRWNVW